MVKCKTNLGATFSATDWYHLLAFGKELPGSATTAAYTLTSSLVNLSLKPMKFFNLRDPSSIIITSKCIAHLKIPTCCHNTTKIGGKQKFKMESWKDQTWKVSFSFNNHSRMYNTYSFQHKFIAQLATSNTGDKQRSESILKIKQKQNKSSIAAPYSHMFPTNKLYVVTSQITKVMGRSKWIK